MGSNSDNWIRIFDIPETSKHRKGFTIYKVISMLYPENCPDAITKITVWKRFNDFKKLHREIKVLHNKLNIRDKYPSLPSSTFFKRFDDETVQARKQSILTFLEYVGDHSQLFTSNEFVKFFESSHAPMEQLNSNINSIRADLNLPEDPEFYVGNSDDDRTISDTDSITTNSDFFDSGPQNLKNMSKSKLSLNTSHHSKNSDSISVSTTTDSITLLDGQIYPTPPNTPQCADTLASYITDATLHVNIAAELENQKKYEEAFIAYKAAIDILLKYGKDDKDYERRQLVRYKTDKYLIKAEKIYNMYLASEVQNLKQITESEETEQSDEHVQRPISDLYKYKVVRGIASGMLVLHAELQQLFYIKVIHKTMKFLNDNLILPEHVPYMVKLHNYYNCENALFLVLEYCSGKKLWDYIKYRSENPDDIFYHNDDQILRQVQDMDLSDPESEHSYSDLINDYTNNKSKKVQSTNVENDFLSDDSYEKVNLEDFIGSNRNIMDAPVPSRLQQTPDLLTKSLVSKNVQKCQSTEKRRKMSEMSSFEDVDVAQNFAIPMECIVKWAAQLVLSLEKLHALGVICYDLQSHNLLINENGDLVLTYMCNGNEMSEIFCNGKMLHIAPELYTFEPTTSAVDWWYFGTILYELLVGMPLSSIHPDGLANCTNLKIPKYVSPEGRSLLRQLLTTDPTHRLGFGVNGTESLKSHPFFHSVSWEKLLEKYNY